jgi:hypothetical protein
MLTAYHYWLFDFRSDAVGDARLTCTDLSVNSCNIGQVWTTQVFTTELDNLPGRSPDGSGIVFSGISVVARVVTLLLMR